MQFYWHTFLWDRVEDPLFNHDPRIYPCLLCILTIFWVLRTLERWSKILFWSVYNLFCLFLTFFSDFYLYLPKIILHSNKICFGDFLTQFLKHSSTFFYFSQKITEKRLKWTKKVENSSKKAFGCGSTQKLVEIHNTCS